MIDIATEQVISLTEATKRLPGRPHLSTIWRWFARGVRGQKLETVIVGGRRYTSVEAIDRFVAATSAAPGTSTPTPPRDRARRQRAAAAACDAAGI